MIICWISLHYLCPLTVEELLLPVFREALLVWPLGPSTSGSLSFRSGRIVCSSFGDSGVKEAGDITLFGQLAAMKFSLCYCATAQLALRNQSIPKPKMLIYWIPLHFLCSLTVEDFFLQVLRTALPAWPSAGPPSLSFCSLPGPPLP